MIRSLALFAALVGAAIAQPGKPPAQGSTQPATQTAPRGRGASSSTANAPAASGASYKDLKYPPLPTVEPPKVENVTLTNGLRFLLMENHDLPIVEGMAMVRTGNLLDPPDKVGLAALTGMTLRSGGTLTQTGEQLDHQLENVGGSVESAINESSGEVSFFALRENLDVVLQTFHDVLSAPAFRPDRVEASRAQLRNLVATRFDNPRNTALHTFIAQLYGPSSPYGWNLEYATVDRITRADLTGFYKQYFFPKNIQIAIWGDFESANMRTRLEQLFGGWKADQQPVREFPKVLSGSAPAGILLATRKDTEQTWFMMGHLAGELRDKDYGALTVLASILNANFQGRLGRTTGGRANYRATAEWGAFYDHPGTFSIVGSTRSIDTVDAIKSVKAVVERVRGGEINEEELKSARDTILNGLVFSTDSPRKILGRMLSCDYFGYPPDQLQQYQKAVAAVTLADVLRVAKERLKPEEFAVVVVGNPDGFVPALETLGSVKNVDLTITPPESEPAKTDPASLEQGQKFLARAQEAAGGAAHLSEVKDFTQILQVSMAAMGGGGQMKETDRWISPGNFRQDGEGGPSGRLALYCDGKIAWFSSLRGSGPLTGQQLKDAKGEVFRSYFSLLLSDKVPGRVVSALDPDTLEITSPEGLVVQVALDPSTGLVQSIAYETLVANGMPVRVQETFSDFHDVGGIKVPFKIVGTRAGMPYSDSVVTDFKTNTGLKAMDLERRP